MTKTKKRPQDEGIDLIENPEALASKAEEFFNSKKNQNLVFGIGGVLVLIISGFLAYQYYINNQNQEAQEEMFQAIYYFETDSLGRALNGDGNNYGFLDIIDLYPATAASEIAGFYAGTIYMKLSDYENAIRYLDDFGGSDILLQARAYAMIGDCYVELDELDNAQNYFEKAANYQPNEQFTPGYMAKLALVHEEQGNYQEAINVYDKIISEYVDSPLNQSAKKNKARLEGLLVE